MSAVTTLNSTVLRLLPFVYILMSMTIPLTTSKEMTIAKGVSATTTHAIRHHSSTLQQQENLDILEDILQGKDTHNKRSLPMNDPSLKRSVGGIRDSTNPRRYITASNSFTLNILPSVSGRPDSPPILRAINSNPNASATFDETTACLVKNFDSAFEEECAIGVKLTPNSSVTNMIVYKIGYNSKDYMLCADKKRKEAILEEHSSLKTRTQMMRCIWTIQELQVKTPIHTFYPITFGKRKKSEKMYLLVKKKRNRKKLKVKLMNTSKLQKMDDSDVRFFIHYNKDFSEQENKFSNPMNPRVSTPPPKKQGKRKKKCHKHYLLGKIKCKSKNREKKPDNLLHLPIGSDRTGLIPSVPARKSLLDIIK